MRDACMSICALVTKRGGVSPGNELDQVINFLKNHS